MEVLVLDTFADTRENRIQEILELDTSVEDQKSREQLGKADSAERAGIGCRKAGVREELEALEKDSNSELGVFLRVQALALALVALHGPVISEVRDYFSRAGAWDFS